ncbi:MAG: Hpt domain-containing protein, partial [Kiritimatiellae bacterium]|nr:Hpt domain-containing protein [Kiritimatiellia bacterium]
MDATQKSQLDTFVWESREHLDLLEPALLRLQQEPANADLINGIFRAAHSIKGGAGFFGLTHIQELSHGLEHIMSRVRDGEASVTAELLDLLLAGVDKLRLMIDDPEASGQVDISNEMDGLRGAFDSARSPGAPVAAGEAEGFSGGDVVDLAPFHVTPEQVEDVAKKSLFVYRVRFFRVAGAPPVNYVAKMESVGVVLDAVTRMPDAPGAGSDAPDCEALFASVLQEDMIDIALEIPREHYESVSLEVLRAYLTEGGAERPAASVRCETSGTALVPAGRAERGAGGGKAEDTVRLPVSLLDDLMNLAGELVLGRNQLLMLSDQLSDRVNGFTPALRNIDRVATGLRDKVMSTRLQPLGNLFNRFKR